MKKVETLKVFYDTYFNGEPENTAARKEKAESFNVYRRNEFTCKLPYYRRDFFKISLVLGTGRLEYADRGIEIEQPALILSNPNIPYSWQPQSAQQGGYFCVFKEDFLEPSVRSRSVQASSLFKVGGNPIFFPDDKHVAFISDIFEKMLEEVQSTYANKYDVLRMYIDLLLHEALKIQPANQFTKIAKASSRITNLFLELLERQFPIDDPAQTLRLKTAHDFALHLSVHVNHLNRAVKEVTGKTTTECIAERLVQEARMLLLHTNWNISEIAYSLGFEYPAYFNNFFRKQTGKTPSELRNAV
jgi:AraC-like DNA-binding protein